MTFFEFLRDKLLYPLATTSLVVQSIFEAIGEMFDNLLIAASTLSLEWFPLYSQNIKKHMIDRGIKQFPGESFEALKNRVVYAYLFYKEAKTLAGIKKILSHYISADSIITFVNGEPFAYYITIDEILTTAQKDVVLKMLDEYKKAHVKVYLLCPDSYNDWIVGESFIGEIRI